MPSCHLPSKNCSLVVPSALQLLSSSIPEEKTQAHSSALLSPSLAMDSEYEVGRVRKLQARHAQMQEKTFTNWINNIFRLGRVSKAWAPPVLASDLGACSGPPAYSYSGLPPPRL